jgi:hypothetical protein
MMWVVAERFVVEHRSGSDRERAGFETFWDAADAADGWFAVGRTRQEIVDTATGAAWLRFSYTVWTPIAEATAEH